MPGQHICLLEKVGNEVVGGKKEEQKIQLQKIHRY